MGDDILARRGLFSRQTTMDRTGDAEPVREAEIVISPPDVLEYRLDDFPAAFCRRPAALTSRHVLLTVPFALPELGIGCRFVAVRIQIWFDVHRLRALRLDPGERAAEAPAGDAAELLVGLGPAQAVPGPLERRSIVTTWGLGGADVRWRFTAQPGVTIREGDSVVRVLLEVPSATTVVPGLIDCSVLVERARMDLVEVVTATLDEHVAFRVDLPPPG